MSQQSQTGGLSRTGKVVISIDGMSGDKGAAAVVGGMDLASADNPDVFFIVHGDEQQLAPLLRRHAGLSGRTEIRHATKIISMDEKPSHAMRQGKGSTMWNCLETVENGEATVAVSCGNTGALMAIAMLRLRKVQGVSRPAIACFWPSANKTNWNVVLDVGAAIEADADDLVQYSIMGASYARNALGIARPRIGLLNVGTEEHKGRSDLHVAAEAIAAISVHSDFEYVGYVEGSDMASDKVDVIVTDGFSGNIALKTGEGTATLIRNMTREAFEYSLLSRIGAFFAMNSLRRLRARIDPRNANGGVFLGLNGVVVKSHGGADAKGVAAAIKLAIKLAQNSFSTKLAARVAAGLALRSEVAPQGQI